MRSMEGSRSNEGKGDLVVLSCCELLSILTSLLLLGRGEMAKLGSRFGADSRTTKRIPLQHGGDSEGLYGREEEELLSERDRDRIGLEGERDSSDLCECETRSVFSSSEPLE